MEINFSSEAKNEPVLKDYMLHVFEPYSSESLAFFLPLKYQDTGVKYGDREGYFRVYLCSYNTLTYKLEDCAASAKTIYQGYIDKIFTGEYTLYISSFSNLNYFYIIKDSGFGKIAYAANKLELIIDPTTNWVSYYLIGEDTYTSIISGVGNRA